MNLKDCPFCGSEPDISMDKKYVKCDCCNYVYGGFHYNTTHYTWIPVETWNTRSEVNNEVEDGR